MRDEVRNPEVQLQRAWWLEQRRMLLQVVRLLLRHGPGRSSAAGGTAGA